MDRIKRLAEIRQEVEDNDGTVFYTPEVEKELNELRKKETQRIIKQKELHASYYQFKSVLDMDMTELKLLMDSIVDACCSQGCVCEPDGYCKHGHPSVLLANGMI